MTMKKKDADAIQAENGNANGRAKAPDETKQEKKGLWGKIRSIFK